MSDELREEIDWLVDKIKSLEEYIHELEFENHQLKSSIGNAIQSLEKQNNETKKIIWGETGGTITTDENFVPLIKRRTKK